MKLISWNVNGLRSIYTKGFSDFLTQESPDILCLQETKVVREQLTAEQSEPPNYCLELSAAKRRGYSGVATLRHCDFEEPLGLKLGLGDTSYDDEGRYIISEHSDFTLYNIYFPSGSSGDLRQGFKYQFLEHLYAHLESLSSAKRGRLIICGDFNICHRPIDIHHPKQAEKLGLSGFLPDERAWMDRFASLGFVDTFRHHHGEAAQRFSWWTFRANAREKNLGWRIDYIFVGTELAQSIRNADIHEQVMGSDHCPVSVELEL